MNPIIVKVLSPLSDFPRLVPLEKAEHCLEKKIRFKLVLCIISIYCLYMCSPTTKKKPSFTRLMFQKILRWAK